MRTFVIILLVLAVAASSLMAATSKPKYTKMDGQMLCLWCDVVLNAVPNKNSEPHMCMAVFRASTGKFYTLVPDKMGKELGALEMHEQNVDVRAYVLPGTQIIDVQSYKQIGVVKPVTPEEQPWFNY